MSELATTIELHDRGVDHGWRDLVLSDIGREKMERVRSLGEQPARPTRRHSVAVGRRRRLPDL